MRADEKVLELRKKQNVAKAMAIAAKKARRLPPGDILRERQKRIRKKDL